MAVVFLSNLCILNSIDKLVSRSIPIITCVYCYESLVLDWGLDKMSCCWLVLPCGSDEVQETTLTAGGYRVRPKCLVNQ